MSLLLEAEAESDLLLIEGLEIDPLPDALLRIDALGTSDGPGGCCSLEQCSTRPREEGMCSCDACSGGSLPTCTWFSLVEN